MPDQDCDALQARADMLHAEARMGVEQAQEEGPFWKGFTDQLAIAERCAGLAAEVDAKIEERC